MSDEKPTAEGHCWHLRSMGMLPGKKGLALLRERCCWCGHENERTRKSVPDHEHGPHEKSPRKSVDVDTNEVPVCVDRPHVSRSEA